MRRIIGLLLIIRAITPLLIVLSLCLTFAIILGDLQAAIDAPIQGIQKEITTVQTALGEAEADITEVVEAASTAVDTLTSFNPLALIPNIPSSISIPNLSLPDLNIPVPTASIIWDEFDPVVLPPIDYPSGLNIGTTTATVSFSNITNTVLSITGLSSLDNTLNNALSGITGMFDEFQSAFDSIGALSTTLQTLPASFQTIVTESGNLLSNVRQVFVDSGGTLVLVFIVLLALVLIYFAVPMLDDFTRGWRMLRGLPADGA